MFAATVVALCAAPARDAHAGGFYLAPRGVRPLARGGAFVAGADDQHAVFYNPAGLAQAGRGVLFDVAYVGFTNSYTRQAVAPTVGGMAPSGSAAVIDFAPVSGRQAPLVIPTLVVSHNFGLRQWNFAAGVYAPNAVITSYEDTPLAPQRYSMVSFEGSLLAVAGVYASFAPIPQLSIGAGFEMLVGSLSQRLALSACPATITCAPEDPEWDAVAQLNGGPLFSPSGRIGIRWAPSPVIAFGLSGSLPFWINAPATLGVRLPSHPFYDGAMVQGNRAGIALMLPPVVRAGVEVRPTRNTRIELAFGWEAWTVHDRISLTPTVDAEQPNGIQLTNVRGVGTYTVGPTGIDRGFQHSFSVALGGEHDFALANQWHVVPRLGFNFDSSATAPEYTTVLTPDGDKFTGAVGLAVGRANWRIEATYAHTFVPTVVSDPRQAQIRQVAPLRSSDQAPRHTINGGRYDMALNIFGLGVRVGF